MPHAVCTCVNYNVLNFLGALKLGNNELGYNKTLGYNVYSVLTNKFVSPKWSFYYTNQPGYNKLLLQRPNFTGPEIVVVTELECNYVDNKKAL